MSEGPRVEWHGRVDFAEAAEVVGVPTDQVLAINLHGGALLVLYTLADAEPEDDVVVYSRLLARDRDGVLVPLGRGPRAHPEMWAELRRALEGEG